MKKALLLIVTLLLLNFLSPVSVSAVNEHANIPERTGDYPDPEHPGMRVHVFVHPQKPPEIIPQTCPDLESTAPVDLAGWHLPTSVTYSINFSSLPSSVAVSFPTLTTAAFNTWSNAIPRAITFTRGPDTTKTRSFLDGINLLTWGATNNRTIAVTYIRYYKDGGLVADVDTIFNKKLAWGWTSYRPDMCGNFNTYDAQNILTHELGHWIGLDDEYASSYIDNTMFGYGSKGEIKKDTLTAGDTINLSTLYH